MLGSPLTLPDTNKTLGGGGGGGETLFTIPRCEGALHYMALSRATMGLYVRECAFQSARHTLSP